MSEVTGMKSISELQRLTGVDRVTIGKRLAHITPTFGAKGAKSYDARQVLPLILATKSADQDESKDRKLAAEAEKIEIQVARLRGELVSVADMKQAAGELLKTMYQRTVRVVPQILASKLVGLMDAVEIETIIRSELAQIFDELRTSPEKFLTIEPSAVVESEDEE